MHLSPPLPPLPHPTPAQEEEGSGGKESWGRDLRVKQGWLKFNFDMQNIQMADC